MKRSLFLFTVPALIVLVALPRAAAAGFSTGGAFTAPGYGARAWGMAGAAIATGGDESAAFWNPALLGLARSDRLGLSYINLVPGADAQQSYAAYTHVFKRGETDAPGLEYAGHAAGAIYGNLAVDLADGQEYTENALRLAYAFTPQYFVSVGAALSLLSSSSDVDGFGSNGTSFDLGVRVVLREHLTAATVLRNLFSQVNFDDGRNFSLSRSLTLGLAYGGIAEFVAEGDLVFAFGDLARAAFGGEYTFFDHVLAVRGGLAVVNAGESRTVPHLGIGFRVGRIQLDYNANFDEEDAFDDTHRFALGIGL